MGTAENPVHRLLDEAGVPWRSSRAALAERYVVRAHPAYGWDIIEIATVPPIVEGLLWPLSAQVFPQFSPHFPATDFSGIAYAGDDARENLRHATKQLEPRLGKPQSVGSSNTIGRRWTFGAAAISLTVWRSDIQLRPMKNPAHEPHLKAGCHVAIATGFRPNPDARELAWLASFAPIARIVLDREIRADALHRSPAWQGELEFVREPTADVARLFGFVGCSADRAALIFCHAQLYLVPIADVIGFRVERTLPAKGSGGSRLFVDCRTDFPDLAQKSLKISAAKGVEDSNDLAAALSAATGKRFTLGDYGYDA